MSQVPSVVANATRLLNRDTDVDDGDDIAPPSSPAVANARIQLDAASRVASRTTPQDVQDMRRVPRMSLQQINDFDPNMLAQRLAVIRGNESASGIEKFFDLIDLPRNIVANTVTSVLAPAIRERKNREGDFGTLGLERVMFSDILREMGIKNRVVRGVVGFVGDVVFDPLTYLGGIGVVKNVGKGGAQVALTRGGSKALQRGIKAFAAGEDIADEGVRRVVETAAQTLRNSGKIQDGMKAEEIASVLNQSIRGEMGRFSTATSRLGLGGTARGGFIVDDTLQVTEGTVRAGRPPAIPGTAGRIRSRAGYLRRPTPQSVAEVAGLSPDDIARIEAVKDFVGANTVARGIDLTGGAGGAQILHLPFTDRALTVPEFTVPLLGYQAGRNQVMQVAFAAARRGDVEVGSEILSSLRRASQAKNAMQSVMDGAESVRLADRELESIRAANAADGLPTTLEEMETAVDQARSAKMAAVMERGAVAGRDTPAARAEAQIMAQRAQIDEQIRAVREAKRQATDVKPGSTVTIGNDPTTRVVRDVADGRAFFVDGDPNGVPFDMLRVQGRQQGPLFAADGAPVFRDFDAELAELNARRSALAQPLADARFAADDEARQILGPLDETLLAASARADLLRDKFDEMAAATNAFDFERAKVAEAHERLNLIAEERTKAFGQAIPDDGLDIPLNATPGDAILIGMLRQQANADFKAARQARIWNDVENQVAQLTRADITQARRARQALLDEAQNRKLVQATATYDDMLQAAEDGGELEALIQIHKARAEERWKELVEAPNIELELREQIADSFSAMVDATAEVAMLRGESLHGLMSSKDRMLTNVAQTIWGIDDPNVAAHTFAPVERMFRAVDNEYADKAAAAGGFVGKYFRTGKGVNAQRLAAIRRSASTQAETDRVMNRLTNATPEIDGFRGFDSIAREYEIGTKHMNTLTDLLGLTVERLRIAQAGGRVSRFENALPDSRAKRFAGSLAELRESMGMERFGAMMNDVSELARQTVAEYDSLAKIHAARGDLSMQSLLYTSLQTTPEARAAIVRNSSSRGQNRPTLAKVMEEFITDPGQARITNIIETRGGALGMLHARLILADEYAEVKAALTRNAQQGNVAAQAELDMYLEQEQLLRQFLEERTLYRMDDAGTIFRIDPEDGTSLRQVSNAEVEQVLRDASRFVMPSEANELAESGFYNVILGGKISDMGDVFEMNPIITMQRRVQASVIQEATETFSETITPFVRGVRPITQGETATRGRTWETARGQPVEFLGEANGMRRFRIDGQVYREIDASKFNRASTQLADAEGTLFGHINPGVQGTGGDAVRAVLPEELALEVEKFFDMLSPDYDLSTFWQTASKITGLWRTSTLAHPSWPVTNAVGNMVLAAINAPEIIADPRKGAKFVNYMGQAIKMMIRANSGKRLATDAAQVNIGSGFMGTDQVMRAASQEGLTGTGQTWEIMRQVFTNARAAGVSGARRPESGLFKYERAAYRMNYEQLLAANGQAHPNQSKRWGMATRAAAQAAMARGGTFDRMMRGWFKLNGGIDDSFRLAMFMYKMDEGMDAASAAAFTRKSMLNFGDMSSLESNRLRVMIPFYSWMRASAPHFLRATFTEPRMMATVPKLHNALEEATAGEGRVPRHMRPDWLRQTMALQIGSDPETAKAFLFSTLIPQEGAAEIFAGAGGLLGPAGLGPFDGGDFLDSLNWLGGQLSPAFKAPIELGSGTEMFTGRTIGAAEGEGDITLPGYLAGQIRWARELGIGQPGQGGLQRAFDTGPAAGLGRLVIGGRIQQDQFSGEGRQRALRFAMKDREGEIRKAIARADKRGDTRSMAEMRIKLLELYQEHIVRGGDPADIPVWARRDLESARAESVN